MDLVTLIPSAGNLVFTIAAFVLALSIIVTVHEYGHYIVGRWTGIKAEVFSLGFGPVLVSRIDRHGTKWQIAALPLGGFVRFMGDASATSARPSPDVARMDQDTRRHTMHGAPLWARTATVAAGPLFNFALAILVFAALSLARGVAVDPPTVGALVALPPDAVEQGGLAPGDTILALNGVPTPDHVSLLRAVETLPVDAPPVYTVRRDGAERDVPGPFPFPPIVSSVQPRTAAADAGLRPGDVVVAIAGEPVRTFRELQARVAENGGQPVAIRIWRAGETLEFSLTPKSMDLPLTDGSFETRWIIGMNGGLAFESATRMPGPVEALSYGVDQLGYILQSSLSALYHMLTGAISSCNLSGPIGIAETSGAAASQGLETFIWFIAMLSAAVGLLNLFPIPVLDGGHLVFYLYEGITGRPPSDRAMRFLTAVGLAMLLGLMAFALTNDLVCP
ncbi:RIP metalloprotease RseP [Rhodovulum strictum]|uniref:Zinc metalloprotease n=1 Tax=Rhodovulum strictum TaxID=58314 RepID=A0A844B7J3_9RHOB|nr:RIP metalloprotease RseP [Rhodovulum strictum]MRH20354.1 RIP metalloprotease RseP [Rhodovulum strictum]